MNPMMAMMQQTVMQHNAMQQHMLHLQHVQSSQMQQLFMSEPTGSTVEHLPMRGSCGGGVVVKKESESSDESSKSAIEVAESEEQDKNTTEEKKDTLKTVAVYSVGLENMNMHPRASFKAVIESNELQDKFKQRFHWLAPPDFFVDARDFHDRHGPSGHSGEHAKSIELVVRSTQFGLWLADIKDFVCGIWGPGPCFMQIT